MYDTIINQSINLLKH